MDAASNLAFYIYLLPQLMTYYMLPLGVLPVGQIVCASLQFSYVFMLFDMLRHPVLTSQFLLTDRADKQIAVSFRHRGLILIHQLIRIPFNDHNSSFLSAFVSYNARTRLTRQPPLSVQ